MKKVLSLVLVIAMVLSSMSFAFAGTFEDVTGDYEDAINTLVALGIVTGYEDGTFRPEKVVTRAEMAKLMVVTLGYGDLISGSKSNFVDTQGHWADAYIALAAGKGIVLGDGNGNFRPDATVTYNEVLTMLVRGLGYTDTCNELKGMSWPTNFKVKAAELGITEDVVMSSTGADRGGVAQAIYNALEETLVTVNSDGDVVLTTTQTTDNDGDVVVKYTKLLSRIAKLETVTIDENSLDEDAKDYLGNLVDLEPYMFQSVDVYTIDGDVVYVDDINSVVVEGTITDLLVDGTSIDDLVDKDPTQAEITAILTATDVEITVVIEDANEKEHEFVVEDDVESFYNGAVDSIAIENFDDYLYYGDTAAAKVVAVIDDEYTGSKADNGKADDGEEVANFVIEKATEAVLVDKEYVEGKSKIYGEVGTIALPTDDGDLDVDNITVTGEVSSLEEIAVGDVVVAYKDIDQTKVELVVVRNSVEGLVTSTNTSGSNVYVEETKYVVSDIVNAIVEGNAQAGDEGTFYLDDAGKIFAIDTEGEDLTDYAVVVDKADGTVNERYVNNYSVDEDAELKLLTADGDTVTYPILADFDGKTLDDVATLDEDSDLLDDALTVQTLAVGDLIRYSVDEDGNIDAVELIGDVTADAGTYDEADRELLDTDDIADVTTEDSLVFYFDNNGTASDLTDDSYDVVSLSSVENGTATVVYYTSGSDKDKIAVIYTDSAASTNDGVYGVIKSVSYVLNADKDKVKQVTAFIDGEEVVFLTEDADVTAKREVTTAQAIKFDFNTSDEIEDTDVVIADGTNITPIVVTSIDSTYVNGTARIATDCVVYIYDESADSWSIGDKSDIDEEANQTAAYAVDTDESTRVDIVVQFVD